MSKISIAIIGTIGVGKSTFIERLKESFQDESFPDEILAVGEPSVSIDFLKDTLKKFYKETKQWAYPLQLGVSAAQEIHFQNLRASDYDIAIMDAPYSSYMYCKIHEKAGRLTEKEIQIIDGVSRPFPFDYIIIIEETADITIDRIMKRNRSIELTDLLYLHEHIRDYSEFREEYIQKYFSGAEQILLKGLPDDRSDQYQDIIEDVKRQILRGKNENT
jgi:deoxyadenosine/deoxycytidine kinase